MELKIVLDTSAYSAFNKNQFKLERFINAKNQIYIPIVVIGELRAGFEYGNITEKNEGLLCDFLDTPNIHILKISEKTTKIYSKIFAQLRKAGTPIGTNDMWIAALCLEHKLPLLTLDSDFANVKGLDCLTIA